MRDISVYLADIIESCDFIAEHIKGVSLDDFRKDTLRQDAVIRRFEIIGEAVKHVPSAMRAQYQDVPWQEAAAFRDVLIHDYPEVIIDDVYGTATEDLPNFRNQIATILSAGI